jgi:predicted ATP-dependent endonuclease of OLD family
MRDEEKAVAITKLLFEHFTAFNKLNINLAQGVNVFIGNNGTGKTHLMKAAYAACDISKTNGNLAEKFIRVYMPSGQAIGRLVKRQQGSTRCKVEIHRGEHKIQISFSNHAKLPKSATIHGAKWWMENPIESVFIPVKEMLSNGPGFRSLYAQREIYFEEVYADILDRAYRPMLKGPIDRDRKKLLNTLQEIMEGKVTTQRDEFFLRNRQGNLEFMLLAEGVRKLGLLWLLIQNGTLTEGSVLFWDEPETNLNPSLFGHLIEILFEIQRMGVQVFLTTHDYVILKEIDLRKQASDNVLFHALYRDKQTGDIRCDSTSEYLEISPNAIADTFGTLYDREIARSLGAT